MSDDPKSVDEWRAAFKTVVPRSNVVVQLPKRPKPVCEEADAPHIVGTAVCGACSDEWSAVVPVGETWMECPKCSRNWGSFKHQIEPEKFWRCNCGETLFWLTPTRSLPALRKSLA